MIFFFFLQPKQQFVFDKWCFWLWVNFVSFEWMNGWIPSEPEPRKKLKSERDFKSTENQKRKKREKITTLFLCMFCTFNASVFCCCFLFKKCANRSCLCIWLADIFRQFLFHFIAGNIFFPACWQTNKLAIVQNKFFLSF